MANKVLEGHQQATDAALDALRNEGFDVMAYDLNGPKGRLTIQINL